MVKDIRVAKGMSEKFTGARDRMVANDMPGQGSHS
jgi:hypothetical protein